MIAYPDPRRMRYEIVSGEVEDFDALAHAAWSEDMTTGPVERIIADRTLRRASSYHPELRDDWREQWEFEVVWATRK